MTTTLLATDALFAGYNGMVVARDITLEVGEGEIVAVLGPNGAGKTTTLLTISSILPAIAGSVFISGRRVTGWAPQKVAQLRVAHVPEGRAIFSGLTVRENLEVAQPWRQRKAAIAEVIRYFPPLGDLMKRRAGLLSGGEQQMLVLARALTLRPRLLMIDEMSLGLAPLVVDRLLNAVREIASDRGCGVLLVEQHVQMALKIADRAYLMVHGDIVGSGPAHTLLRDRAIIESGYMGGERLAQNDATPEPARAAAPLPSSEGRGDR